MDLVSLSTSMGESMKENGNKIRDMEEAMKYSQAVTLIMGHMKMESLTEKAFTNGKMARFMMESGLKVSSMATECGKVPMANLTSASGFTLKLRDTECMYLITVISMRASGINVSEREMARISSPMETVTSASTHKVSLRASDSTNGKIESQLMTGNLKSVNLIRISI